MDKSTKFAVCFTVVWVFVIICALFIRHGNEEKKTDAREREIMSLHTKVDRLQQRVETLEGIILREHVEKAAR